MTIIAPGHSTDTAIGPKMVALLHNSVNEHVLPQFPAHGAQREVLALHCEEPGIGTATTRIMGAI